MYRIKVINKPINLVQLEINAVRFIRNENFYVIDNFPGHKNYLGTLSSPHVSIIVQAVAQSGHRDHQELTLLYWPLRSRVIGTTKN